MSYMQYIQLYSNTSKLGNNNHNVIKRGAKNNYWFHSLKIKNKLDIYDGKGDNCWHIGTVIKMEKINNKQTKLFIHYDGWKERYDEWINIDHTKLTSTKLKKLNTITPYHDYLNNSSKRPCKWSKTSKWKKCIACNRKCCTKCCFFGILKNKLDDIDHNKCKECMKRINYQNLFNIICSSIYDQYEIDINIIYLLTEYSFGISIFQCSNTNKQCLNEINFESQYELEMNLYRNISFESTSIYQYCPKYVNKGTVTIYGKNRRIFCEECTKNYVRYCSKCYHTSNYIKEATTDDKVAICHNHRIIECVICNQLHDEFKWGNKYMFDCTFCGNKHCKKCRNPRCIKCNGCMSDRKLMKCTMCNDTLCDYCMEKYCHSCYAPKCNKCINIGLYGCQCVQCGDLMCNHNGCDIKNDLKECELCGNNSVCEQEPCHQCPILDDWTRYDDEYDDYTLDDDFIKKYCYNTRTYKIERKLNGFERSNDLQKYYQRKQRKKSYRQKTNKYLVQF